MEQLAVSDKAGWAIKEFCAQVSISRTTLHGLPPERQPKSVVVGARRIITESPREYLQRIASAA